MPFSISLIWNLNLCQEITPSLEAVGFSSHLFKYPQDNHPATWIDCAVSGDYFKQHWNVYNLVLSDCFLISLCNFVDHLYRMYTHTRKSRVDRARNPKAYIPSARYRSDQFCNYPRSFEVKRGRRIDPTGTPSSLLRLIMSLLLRERLKTMYKTIACILSPTLTMGRKGL